jgi:DNA-3-methyladenine glycosylase
MTPLPRSFFANSPLEVGPLLLGKVLCHEREGVLTSGRIVEVEAYLGSEDPASHAYHGMTRRNRVMFGPPGHAYVYFTYGKHFCVNAVTDREGVPSALLIRALKPLAGIEAMKERRLRNKERDLTSGPGKLAQALAIDARANGLDLTRRPLWIGDDGGGSGLPYEITRRIGIERGVDLPYRFVVRS